MKKAKPDIKTDKTSKNTAGTGQTEEATLPKTTGNKTKANNRPGQAAEYHRLLEETRKEIRHIVIGQDKVVTGLFRGLLCNCHVLVEGIPGIAKTLLIRALAKVTGGKFSRIQFTVDLLPTDIVGITTYHEKKRLLHHKRTYLRQLRNRRRNKQGTAKNPVSTARSDAGKTNHNRKRNIPNDETILRNGNAKPDRNSRSLPVTRSASRQVPVLD